MGNSQHSCRLPILLLGSCFKPWKKENRERSEWKKARECGKYGKSVHLYFGPSSCLWVMLLSSAQIYTASLHIRGSQILLGHVYELQNVNQLLPLDPVIGRHCFANVSLLTFFLKARSREYFCQMFTYLEDS